MIPILYLYFIETKKEQAINLPRKYFHEYDTYTYVSSKSKRNKQQICATNIVIPMIPMLHYKQKEQAINLRQKYFHHYDTYVLLIFHQNQKGTSNKFAEEIFSSL